MTIPSHAHHTMRPSPTLGGALQRSSVPISILIRHIAKSQRHDSLSARTPWLSRGYCSFQQKCRTRIEAASENLEMRTAVAHIRKAREVPPGQWPMVVGNCHQDNVRDERRGCQPHYRCQFIAADAARWISLSSLDPLVILWLFLGAKDFRLSTEAVSANPEYETAYASDSKYQESHRA